MPQGEPSGKPINKVRPFCPRATAEGMAGSGSAVHCRVPNLETGERVLWIYGASCARTSAVFICRLALKPKGRDIKDRRESARRPGLRKLGLAQKAGMVNVHLAVLSHFSSIGRAFVSKTKGCRFEPGNCDHYRQSVYGFRKENQLIVLQYEHL